MENITASEIFVCCTVLVYLGARLMKMLGWHKGALIADELGRALQEAGELIMEARVKGAVWNIDRAAEAAAAKIKGVDAGDLRPVVEGLVTRASHEGGGVSVSIDGRGNVRVDPTGLASKLARKAGKWLKKVF